MADWLKFDSGLPEKPETLAITVEMGWDDPDLTVGKLMKLFRWFDQHTSDGNASGVTFSLLDRYIGVTGFLQAVHTVGWIVRTDTGIRLHNFDFHNGNSAKKRAKTASRVAKHRQKQEVSDYLQYSENVTLNALPEKRREEKNKDIAEKKPLRKRKTLLPNDFGISENVLAWAKSKGFGDLEQRLEHFRGWAIAGGKEYVDWDQTFQNAIRDDWAKLNGKKTESNYLQGGALMEGMLEMWSDYADGDDSEPAIIFLDGPAAGVGNKEIAIAVTDRISLIDLRPLQNLVVFIHTWGSADRFCILIDRLKAVPVARIVTMIGDDLLVWNAPCVN